MNWGLFFSTFVTIFIAELGDKTQFAAVAASSQSDSGMSEIWLAVVLALGLAGTLGVLAGRWLAAFLNPDIMRYVSGGLFIAIGFFVLLKK
jgi:putative Ca2+/H+ antiporter (TMEM165/GDT1 family)